MPREIITVQLGQCGNQSKEGVVCVCACVVCVMYMLCTMVCMCMGNLDMCVVCVMCMLYVWGGVCVYGEG